LRRLITKPLMAPITIPTSSVIITTIQVFGYIITPNWGNRMPSLIKPPATIADRPTIEPTERSMPADNITNVIPIPNIAKSDTCFDMITIFATLRNPGETIENTAITIIRATNTRPRKINCMISIPVIRFNPSILVALLPSIVNLSPIYYCLLTHCRQLMH